jgi:hypothetical protein
LEPALPAGSEGPSLIPCAAGCIEVAAFLHHGLLSAPSWRTVVGVAHKAVTAAFKLAVKRVEHDI